MSNLLTAKNIFRAGAVASSVVYFLVALIWFMPIPTLKGQENLNGNGCETHHFLLENVRQNVQLSRVSFGYGVLGMMGESDDIELEEIYANCAFNLSDFIADYIQVESRLEPYGESLFVRASPNSNAYATIEDNQEELLVDGLVFLRLQSIGGMDGKVIVLSAPELNDRWAHRLLCDQLVKDLSPWLGQFAWLGRLVCPIVIFGR